MNLYKRILAATDGIDGWCNPDKQLTLANLVLAVRPSNIVEIGVWGGKSLFPMAITCDHLKSGHCYAIDPWTADSSVQGQEGEDAKWWGDQAKHDIVFKRFSENITRLNLHNWISVERVSSGRANVPESIGLLHLDGNHGPQALLDIQRFGPSIRSGGVCVLDDLGWTGGAVGQASEWLIANGFIELHKLGTGACYLKL